MNQVMMTVVAPLDPALLPKAFDAIDVMGNPADAALRDRLDQLDADGRGVHFISLHALPSFTPGRAHLVLEFTADGDADRAVAQIVAAIGSELATVFALATDWTGTDLGLYLTAHRVLSGHGLRDAPGLAHRGTPGITVGEIRAEQELAASIGEILADQRGGMSALQRLLDVRSRLPEQFRSDLMPSGPAGTFIKSRLVVVVAIGLLSFVRTYLWPFLVGLAAWIGWSGLRLAWQPPQWSWHAFREGLWLGLKSGGPVLLVLLLVIGAALYIRLRRLESTDWISSRAPDPATLREIVRCENHGAQNHMVSLTELKAGSLRRFTTRLIFWAVATIGPRINKPGYLNLIGTIHFARWLTIPGTRDFLFLSNYGGSWEAYLEDFITLAHRGLTGVWSNTVGFPASSNLLLGGASDGERFKRYARQSMLPTRFWYSAYPDLITDMIRANSAIRRGLSGAMTEDDAVGWLSHFGSATKPDDRMVTTEIQSALFGGMGFMKDSAMTLWNLPDHNEAARAWLRDVSPEIAWSDGRHLRDDPKAPHAVIQLALSAAGLAALGLDQAGLATFPAAFLEDITGPGRARILGDEGDNAAEHWWWGQQSSHAAVIIYASDARALAGMVRKLGKAAKAHGAAMVHRVDMETYKADDNYEPFGFADGKSQPLIRGTHKAVKSGDPLHVVAPGEFILGYPDGRGNLPPGPTLPAIADPDNVLPVLADPDLDHNSVNNLRDLGCNGSFLVIRQLEQDPKAFNAYCEKEAVRLKDRLTTPYRVDANFIAAKLVGRWRNGSPLVRAPYSPSTRDEVIAANDFLLGKEDSEGLLCPFGAHIRRANPRDSLQPGSMEQISVSNRHRIIRLGRKYAPAKGQKPGLLFMGLNGDIERQFEFIQQTWLLGNVISLSCPTTLSGEHDPLLGLGTHGFTVPSRDGPIKLKPMSRFITMRGGGYFFLPGRRLINYLGKASA